MVPEGGETDAPIESTTHGMRDVVNSIRKVGIANKAEINSPQDGDG